MAIRITCPGCKSALSLADELRGKKVRCKKCETIVKVPADEEEPEEPAVDESNDEEDDRPKKKKKKKSKKGMSPLMIVIPVLVLVLLVVGGVSAFFFTRVPLPAPQQAKIDPKIEEEVQRPVIFPKRQDGSPTKKGGLGIVTNVRGAVWRTERRNELSGIHKLYNAFILETPKGQHTLDSYLEYIQRDFRAGHDAIKEGYYIMNMKAQSGDIIAGERDLDRDGHLAVFFNGEIRYVPEADWKKAMDIK